MSSSSDRVPTTMRDFFFDDPFFRSSWDDFDAVRERMFQESRDMWKRFDEDFRNMSCMSDMRLTHENNSNSSSSRSSGSSSAVASKESTNSTSKASSSSAAANGANGRQLATRQDSWENGWMFPRKWMLPSLSNEFKDMNLFQSKDNEVIRVKEDDAKMEVSLDTSQYRPDELSVSVANGVVSVEGKHEEKAEDGTRMVSRQFVRKYTLPSGAKPEDVVSNLSSDGVLVITAKKSPPAIDVKINQN